ncbi:MAG TPA: hypothetical protein VF181_08070 [Balneolaceae bacterium]
MADQKNTTDHDVIKKWAESRDGKPAVIVNKGEKTELLRINFPGYSEDNLEEIDWDKWFDIFDSRDLALIYQEKTKDGKTSNFNKLVSRDNVS